MIMGMSGNLVDGERFTGAGATKGTELPITAGGAGPSHFAGIDATSLQAARDFCRRALAQSNPVGFPNTRVDRHVPLGGQGDSSYAHHDPGSFTMQPCAALNTGCVAP